MPRPRRPRNLLALAVLGLLLEQPMHPYEMASTLRERQLDTAFKLSTGTLYDTVRSLAREGWVEEQESTRAGNRPQRTPYRITGLGKQEMASWLDAIIRSPEPEYPAFVSAVAYLGALGPERAAGALDARAAQLRARADELRSGLEAAGGLPRLYLIETEFALHVLEAELEWAAATAGEIRTGTLPWPDGVPLEGIDRSPAPGEVR